ncbi:2OG-Fe(II) oxygenase [Microbulbifer hainanensis]|uniref:2OG-Fe(II) oxygenase n=1 Tax=Microbulbifer hainanensis TaxID=2735675 RepID=UPI0018686407|nr:2OG-Fe(II) oxygenase [Microbulbifer hainanensis]
MITSSYNEFLPIEKLNNISMQESEKYQSAYPFSHGVYDNVFSENLLDQVIEEFEEGEKRWKTFDSKYEKKQQMNRDLSLGSITRMFIHNLNSAPFLEFLEKLTGIEGLIPDPYLHGAGLHKIESGGKLGVHVDFNGHKRMNVYRRLNVLIYLNKNWEKDWGGDFELWDAETMTRQKSVSPIFNRMAIFSTSSTSFHGHPEPLNCPQDRRRISLALYYYTANDPGEQKKELHSTLFLTKSGKAEQIYKQNGRLQRVKAMFSNWRTGSRHVVPRLK